MVTVNPFRGIRPSSSDVDKVASLPYDVVNKREVLEIIEQNHQSYLNIDRTDVKFAVADSDAVYQAADQKLTEFLEAGWLIQEAEPAMYLYRLMQKNRLQYGLVTTIAVDDYLSGAVKRHEFTRPDKEKDRIRHNDATDANTSPIFLAMQKNDRIDEIFQEIRDHHLPVYIFDSFNDTNHCVWKITDAAMLQEITDIFATEVPALYIADGHHRMESAAKVTKMRRETYPDAPTDAAFNYFLGVIFPEDELTILPYNRVVEGQLSEAALQKIGESFTIERITKRAFLPQEKGTFGMYAEGQWYKLTIKPEKVPADPVGSLDASLLQDNILFPVFGIDDPRTNQHIEFVGGIHPVEHLMHLADKDKVAFTLYPTTMPQLLNVADSGEVMPPKSTWFEPKLLSGLFVYPFESEKYLEPSVE